MQKNTTYLGDFICSRRGTRTRIPGIRNRRTTTPSLTQVRRRGERTRGCIVFTLGMLRVQGRRLLSTRSAGGVNKWETVTYQHRLDRCLRHTRDVRAIGAWSPPLADLAQLTLKIDFVNTPGLRTRVCWRLLEDGGRRGLNTWRDLDATEWRNRWNIKHLGLLRRRHGRLHTPNQTLKTKSRACTARATTRAPGG